MPQGETGMKITIEHLTKQYGDFKAVDDLNLEIQDGELVGLLGPSGCGKSTTLFMLSGLTEPSGGRILFGDNDVTTIPPEDREIGLVFQNYALYPHMTVLENIMFPLINRKVPKAEARDRAEKMAEVVHLEGLLHRKPKALSGGQQQRVAIARALVKRPKVLLLDEPLSNLDAKLRVETREEIRRIQQEVKITTIFVTHDQEEAMSISDHIAVMREGVLMQNGRPQEVYDDPASLFVARFLGTPPINVFEGRVKGGKLLIGEEAVLSVNGVPDQEVWIGIRPEGFIPRPDGELGCELSRVEVMGRDISIVSTHKACTNQTIRSIINADTQIDTSARTVRFSLKPGKVFLFHKQSEERIRFASR